MANEKRILVVDDDQHTARLLEVTFQRLGYQIVIAPSGSGGLEKIRIEKPDLVILDMIMPGIDGYEFLQRARQNPETAELPIIAATSDQDSSRALACGANAYQAKPFNMPQLVGLVERLLGATAAPS